MQAIRTVKLAPTNTRGARIKATAAAGSITLPYDHSLRHDLEANHRAAAEALVAKMGWNEPGYGGLVTGCLPDGSYCHALTGRGGKGLD
jgi:hypothetical protein